MGHLRKDDPHGYVTVPEFLARPIRQKDGTLTGGFDGGGFWLPPVKATDHPAHRGLRRGYVPGVTREQLRELVRAGVLDTPKTWRVTRSHAWPLLMWRKAPAARQGDPRLLTAHDVATVRLYCWLRFQGLTRTQAVTMLRGGGTAVRFAIAGTCLFEPDAELIVRGVDAFVFSTADVDAIEARYGTAAQVLYRLPLWWLGVSGDILPRIQQQREAHPTIVRWKQAWTPAALMVAQTQETTELQGKVATG